MRFLIKVHSYRPFEVKRELEEKEAAKKEEAVLAESPPLPPPPPPPPPEPEKEKETQPPHERPKPSGKGKAPAGD